MADHRSNVIPLLGPAGVRGALVPHAEVLRTVAGQLDQLDTCLRQFSPQPTWSAQRWMIASTPFRMRLTSGRDSLGDLASVCATGELAHDRWALELDEARRAAERWLDDIAEPLYALQRTDTSPTERQRQAVVFVSAKSDLLSVLTEIRQMIARRLPAEPGTN